MANTDSDTPKKPVIVFFYFKPLSKATQCEKKEKAKSELKHSYKHTLLKNVRTKGKSEGRTRNLKKTENRSSCEAKKGIKKLKLSSCRPKSIKSWPNSPVASTSKDGVIRCEEEYCDPPTEEWI
ncbi:uncharacterized protein TNCV_2804461 [Trichonephila clavipes]|nr:uncharacterized protein TNCV_2804461 [Trichonephila clavipes]